MLLHFYLLTFQQQLLYVIIYFIIEPPKLHHIINQMVSGQFAQPITLVKIKIEKDI